MTSSMGVMLVPNVQPVKVDVVGLEPLQTGLQRLHHALAMVAGGVWVIAGHGVGILGRQHEALPLALHELAQQPFARSVGIDVGRVDEVATRVKEGVVDLAAFFRRTLPSPNLRRRSWCPGTVPRLEGRYGPIICIASCSPCIGWIVAKPVLAATSHRTHPVEEWQGCVRPNRTQPNKAVNRGHLVQGLKARASQDGLVVFRARFSAAVGAFHAVRGAYTGTGTGRAEVGVHVLDELLQPATTSACCAATSVSSPMSLSRL